MEKLCRIQTVPCLPSFAESFVIMLSFFSQGSHTFSYAFFQDFSRSKLRFSRTVICNKSSPFSFMIINLFKKFTQFCFHDLFLLNFQDFSRTLSYFSFFQDFSSPGTLFFSFSRFSTGFPRCVGKPVRTNNWLE